MNQMDKMKIDLKFERREGAGSSWTLEYKRHKSTPSIKNQNHNMPSEKRLTDSAA